MAGGSVLIENRGEGGLISEEEAWGGGTLGVGGGPKYFFRRRNVHEVTKPSRPGAAI